MPVGFWADRWKRKPDFPGTKEKTQRFFQQRFKQVVEEHKIILENKIGLDIGCGLGENLLWIKNNFNCEMEGVDIGEAPVKKLSEIGVHTYQGNVLEIEFNKKFDFVVVSFLLQHLLEEKEIGDFYAILKKITKRRGYIFIADQFCNSDRKTFAVMREKEFHNIYWNINNFTNKYIGRLSEEEDPTKLFILLQRK